MMNRVKHIILLFTLILSTNISYSQFFLYTDAPVDVNVSFSRQTIESAAKQTFFNSLHLKNNSNHSETFTLNLTVPEGWSVIGGDKTELTIPPLDSLIIPIRIAVSASVRGDIGYSVIASLTDSRGNTIKNEYCYVKIPRETKLNVRFSSRIFFLDPISNSAEFSIVVQNQGNREELVNFLFDGNTSLAIGLQRQSIYSHDISIPPLTDSTLTFKVSLQKLEEFGRTIYGLQSRVSTIDTTYNNTLWFKLVRSKFINAIPSNEVPLSVEFFAQGLADAYLSPNYSLNMEGRLLFKGDSELYYFYRNYSSRTPEDLYRNNRMFVGTHFKNWTLEVGDSYRNAESSMMGRGGYLGFDGDKFKAEIMATKNVQTDVNNIGTNLSYDFSPSLQANTGFAYNSDEYLNLNSKLVYLGSKFVLFKKHNLYIQSSYNNVQREINNNKNHNEFGWQVNYSSNIGAFSTTFRARSASDLHFSPYAGRQEIFGSLIWRKDPSNQLQLIYNENSNKFTIIEGTTISSTLETTTREGNFLWRHYISPEIEVFAGPSFNHYKISGLRSFSLNKSFESVNAKAIVGSRFKNKTRTLIITPSFEFARVNIINNPFNGSVNNDKSPYFSHLSLSLRSRLFTVLAFYTSGPRSSYDQIAYLQTGRDTRKIQVLPTFDYFIYKNIVKLQVGLSYANDMIVKSTYSTINGLLNVYLPKYWELQLLGVYSMQNRINLQDAVETYQTLYIEAGIKKDFNINQPRVKYHNIELVFFKDFNGNFEQEGNEPGIKNILVEFERVSTEVRGKIPGDFFSAELLSDNTGSVVLDKIPEGLYKVKYNPIGIDVGTYSKAIGDSEIRIDRSGKYLFPFVEKNKVFGKIILNRSRLSGLGRIDVSNVRITATDSQGRSYSTLTDKNGEFILFAPVTDEYIVNINNVFYENFDLRQNNFLVQFNGYKQFEVNFVFDEKVRRINFAATDAKVQTGVQQVRRTTISGTIKDINNQQPVRAKVNLINTRTNAVMTSVNSSATSGGYTLQFMASDDYLLEILADDYWYFSEDIVLQQVTTFMNIDRDILLKPISVGSKVELNIRFEANSAHLAPESVAEINRLLRQVKNNPEIRLEIQGHCDNLEAIQNPDVGYERAGAVAKYLIENGFSNVEVKDMKNNEPAATNDTEEGRIQNRRIDVVVVKK